MRVLKLTRLKLTGWYLLIVALVSVSFSAAIYFSVSLELERGFHQFEIRFRAQELGLTLPRRLPERLENLDPQLRENPPQFLFIADLVATRQRLLLRLLLINGGILAVTAVAGYFLAGKTLEPLERAIEEQKRFVADASHELRTPLAALKTSIEVALREKELSLGTARRALSGNLDDVNRLESLTTRLLSLSRLQSGENGLNFVKPSLREVVESAAEKIRPLAKKKGVDLRIEVGDVSLEADKDRLEEVLLIFLDNAIKYTPRGGYVAVTSEVNEREAAIRVEDAGVGIAEEDLPRIFDRFYRADRSRTKIDADGFGLGLALAKGIIEAHKGLVEVVSELGKGTTFTIRLPRRHS